MDMKVKRTKITTWVMEINELKEKGVVICPLMTVHPMEFAPELTACDIPETRKIFLHSHPHAECCSQNRCRPREIYADQTNQERNFPSLPQLKRPHGAWTAALKK